MQVTDNGITYKGVNWGSAASVKAAEELLADVDDISAKARAALQRNDSDNFLWLLQPTMPGEKNRLVTETEYRSLMP